MGKRIVYALPMPGGSAPAEAVVVEGEPARFEKELIREGAWVHPTKQFTFRVTPKRLRAWLEAFGRMKAAGLKVPLPFGHSYDPRDNAGFLDDLRLDGNRLIGVLAVPRPADAERVGSTVRDVSVSVNPNFVDAKGNRFGEVIEHVALTNYPLVEGQSNFAPVERIAAADDGDDTEVWTFCAERVKDPSPGERDDAPGKPGGERREEDAATSAEAAVDKPGGERREEDAPTSAEAAVDKPGGERREEDAPTERRADETANRHAPGSDDARLAASRQARASERERTSNTQHPTSNVQQAQTDVSPAPENNDASTEMESLRTQLAREREDRIAAEVAGHVSAGRLPPTAAEAARMLLACEPATRFDLDTQGKGVRPPDVKGSDPFSVAAAFRTLLSLLPAGASVDLADRTRHLRAMPDPGNSGLATGRATAAAARRMLESRGYAVTLSDDGTTVLEATKEV